MSRDLTVDGEVVGTVESIEAPVIRCPMCGEVVPQYFEHVDIDCLNGEKPDA